MKTIILFLLIIPIYSFGEIGFFYRFKDVIKYKGKCDKILRYKKTKINPFTMLIPNKKPLFERWTYYDFKNPEKHCKSLLLSRDKFKNYVVPHYLLQAFLQCLSISDNYFNFLNIPLSFLNGRKECSYSSKWNFKLEKDRNFYIDDDLYKIKKIPRKSNKNLGKCSKFNATRFLHLFKTRRR